MKTHRFVAFVVAFPVSLVLFASESVLAQENGRVESDEATGPASIRGANLGETKNVHRCGNLFLAGQFTADDLDEIRAAGIRRVISLRTDGEIDWDEAALLQDAGMAFELVPFRVPESLTDDVFDRVRELLQDNSRITLFHCGSANRVGAVWLPWRVLDDGVPLDTALVEAKRIGLRNEAYEERALRYIRRKQTARDLEPKDDDSPDPQESTGDKSDQAAQSPEAMAPGINDSFLDPELDVDKYIKRFEIESREVYSAREAVVQACQIQPGQRVADIGAGTGLYTRLFAEAVGSDGWVFAIDIAPRFIEHINVTGRQAGLFNISGVLGTQASIQVPPEAVDLAFVCDTYHHFESPAEMVQSIYHAIKPGGQLVVIDFERIPGVTREWIVSHVRAGKLEFRHEIESGGFQFVEQVEIPGFAENYFLRFRKDEN